MDKNNVERLHVSVTDNDDVIASMVKAYNDTIRSMVNAYYNGDENLDQFPDSAEKKTVLQDINTFGMSSKKLSSEEISDIGVKLNSSDEVEKTRIILDIVDNYNTSSEKLKEVLRPHKELILRIMKFNKN
jgi:hypothetical protein